ncbi:unnamed protein product [Anisakis simplex]|uniref:Uncharacterized protein n=1 Tax=Anisakis simplex TaxID=6269 RepID=A0A0M3K4D7_ANISI|nr:unnamed protein product [Anisakis simplex]
MFAFALSNDVEDAVHEVTSTKKFTEFWNILPKPLLSIATTCFCIVQSFVKDGATWCPVALVGTQCPSSSIFHYYKCCGTANKDCCFNLQVTRSLLSSFTAPPMLS